MEETHISKTGGDGEAEYLISTLRHKFSMSSNVVFILLGSVYLYGASHYRVLPLTNPGPGFAPVAAGCILIASSLIGLIMQLKSKKVTDGRLEDDYITTDEIRSAKLFKTVSYGVVISAGYLLLQRRIGLGLDSAIFGGVLIFVSGYRRLVVLVFVAVLLGICVQILFIGFLNLPLPSTRLPW